MKHISDFPPDTKWAQTPHGAVAVVVVDKDAMPEVYYLHDGQVVEYKPTGESHEPCRSEQVS